MNVPRPLFPFSKRPGNEAGGRGGGGGGGVLQLLFISVQDFSQMANVFAAKLAMKDNICGLYRSEFPPEGVRGCLSPVFMLPSLRYIRNSFV